MIVQLTMAYFDLNNLLCDVKHLSAVKSDYSSL